MESRFTPAKEGMRKHSNGLRRGGSKGKSWVVSGEVHASTFLQKGKERVAIYEQGKGGKTRRKMTEVVLVPRGNGDAWEVPIGKGVVGGGGTRSAISVLEKVGKRGVKQRDGKNCNSGLKDLSARSEIWGNRGDMDNGTLPGGRRWANKFIPGLNAPVVKTKSPRRKAFRDLEPP